MNTPEQRKEKYKQVSEQVRWFYSSPEAGEIMWNAAQSIGMKDDERYTTYAVTIGDVLLGLEKKSDLVIQLQNQLDITEEQANKLFNALSDFLKNAENALNDWEEKREEQSNILDVVKDGPKNSVAPYVKPLRTMDSDAKNIHGYGAFQAPAGDDEPVHSSSQDSVIKKEQPAEKENPSTPPAN